MSDQQKTRLVDEFTNAMELRKGDAVDFGSWLMEQVDELRKEVIELRAEQEQMLAVLRGVADCPFCTNGLAPVARTWDGEGDEPCQSCGPAREVLLKITGKAR